MHFTERVIRYFSIYSMERGKHLASDPICIWLMSLMVIGYVSYKLFHTFITYRLPWHLVENI